MMGGTISVESEQSKGSRFIVRLPAVSLSTTATRPALQLLPEGATTVLVIDDDSSVRDLLERFLNREGFHVLTASSGEDGIRIAHEKQPDVITLDVIMPVMDGWAVLAKLK